MGIELFWDDAEQTVVLAEFKGKWTWDELHSMLATVKRLSKERGRVLGAIIDAREGLQLPGGNIFNREGLNNFQKILANNDGGESGPVVILGMNGMVRSVFNAVSNFDKSLTTHVQFADTMQEAQSKVYRVVRQITATAS